MGSRKALRGLQITLCANISAPNLIRLNKWRFDDNLSRDIQSRETFQSNGMKNFRNEI